MIKVRVSATSANIGAGFDCLGIAFDMYNEFTFEVAKECVFEGFEPRYCTVDSNLTYKAYSDSCDKLQIKANQLKVKYVGAIPASRGLGSSATCIIAGVAYALYERFGKVEQQQLAYMASVYEGHPDNVAAAVFGGFTCAKIVEEGIFVSKLAIHKDYMFFAMIPNFELSTEQARQVVARQVSLDAAKSNVANVTLMCDALAHYNLNMLRIASVDYLHQPYRAKLIKDFDRVCQGALDCGAVCTFISGAGPTILVIGTSDIRLQLQRMLSSIDGWKAVRLNVDCGGVKITKDF